MLFVIYFLERCGNQPNQTIVIIKRLQSINLRFAMWRNCDDKLVFNSTLQRLMAEGKPHQWQKNLPPLQ